MPDASIVLIRPSECSIWQGNARNYDQLTHDRLYSLIDSIDAEGGNRIPVVVRRTPKAERPFELIIGARRHWAVSWLNFNQPLDMKLRALVENLDDESAFRLADVENREREDISAYERALNYRAALDKYYGGMQSKMADRLKISRTSLSRYLSLASLPQSIVSTFATPSDIRLKHAKSLGPLLRKPDQLRKMEAAAKEIETERWRRESKLEPPLSGDQVVARLVAATAEKRARRAKKVQIEIGGSSIGQIDRDQVDQFTLTLHPNDYTLPEILASMAPLIAAAKFRTGRAG